MKELQNFLYQKIPLSQHMQIQILELNENEAKLFCPLSANYNHMGTAFGGSISAGLLLACYAWFFNVLKIKGIESHVVVKESRINFIHPVESDFIVSCKAPPKSDYEKLLKILTKKDRAKIELNAAVLMDEKICAQMSAEFVAIKVIKTDHQPKPQPKTKPIPKPQQ